MKNINLQKFLKLGFLVLFLVGLIVFAVRGNFKFFEGNDSIVIDFIEVETMDSDLVEQEFNSLISKFQTTNISSIDRESKEINLVGLNTNQVTELVGENNYAKSSLNYPGLFQGALKSEYIYIAALISIFVIGYIFVVRLRKLTFSFKDFSIFAVKVMLLFIVQTVSYIGLLSLISRVYEIKYVDMYSILALNLITAFIFLKVSSLQNFASLNNFYLSLSSLIKSDKLNIIKIVLLFVILLPFGFGVKIISTLALLVFAILFAIYSLELYVRVNLEGIRLSIPERETVTSMVRNIRIRKSPILPLKGPINDASKVKKKTDPKKKKKKEKNKNRR